MAPHQERVVLEKAELDAKLSGLSAFINWQVFISIGWDEINRLVEQRHHMTEYSRILGERIAAFGQVD